MPATLLHTADWQFGKSFASIGDEARRARLQQKLIESQHQTAYLERELKADFVVVFDDFSDPPSRPMRQPQQLIQSRGSLEPGLD